MSSPADRRDPFRSFFETSTEMLAVLDGEGGVLHANPAWEAIIGRLEEGERLLDRVPEPQRIWLLDSLRNGPERGWTGWIRNREGVPEQFTLILKGDGEGRLHATARRFIQADTATEANQRLRVLIRHARLAVIELGWGGHVVSWNPAAEAIFGYSADEAIGRSIDELITVPDDDSLDREAMSQALFSTGVATRVGRNRTKDGRRIRISWQTVLLRDEHGGPIGLAGLGEDVTEVEAQRRALEERTRELNEHAALLTEQQSMIRALSTPILQVWDGVLALPLVGHVDQARAEAIMDALLEEIVRTGSRHAILDVTGVEALDTTTVHHLARLMRAVQLLGAEAILTGVKPAVAQSLVGLGADLPEVPTLRNLQAGLRRCLQARRPARG